MNQWLARIRGDPPEQVTVPVLCMTMDGSMPIMKMELGGVGLRLQRYLPPLTLAISLTHENTSLDYYQGPIFSFFLG